MGNPGQRKRDRCESPGRRPQPISSPEEQTVKWRESSPASADDEIGHSGSSGPPFRKNRSGLNITLTEIIEVLADAISERVCARLNGPARTTRLFTVDQAATYLGRSRTAVEHMINAGKLPVVRLDSRVSLDVKALDRLIEQHTEPPNV